jgi:hypothetical protein
MPVLALKVAALALAASGVAAGAAQAHQGSQSEASVTKVIYIVKPGDTLGGIAGYFCHDQGKYRQLARANGIANPNVISVGEHIWLACGGSGGSSGSSSSSSSSSASSSGSSASGSSYAAGSAAIPATSNVYSYLGLERLWIAAGGSSATASHAACIAEAESGGRSWATGAAGERGLWQIHPSHGSLSTYDPYYNARAAVIISANGTNWGQWTTRSSC